MRGLIGKRPGLLGGRNCQGNGQPQRQPFFSKLPIPSAHCIIIAVKANFNLIITLPRRWRWDAGGSNFYRLKFKHVVLLKKCIQIKSLFLFLKITIILDNQNNLNVVLTVQQLTAFKKMLTFSYQL